jgi:hypothetical protein
MRSSLSDAPALRWKRQATEPSPHGYSRAVAVTFLFPLRAA